MKSAEQLSELSEGQFEPLAGILAWLWPGAGHFYLGQKKRAWRVMGGVLFLLLVGLLVGGIDSVDRKHDRFWFFAQAGTGPIAYLLDLATQSIVQPAPIDWSNYSNQDAYFEQDPALMKRLKYRSLGRVNEMGTLFIAMAGLMNLVVILDALYHRSPMPAVANPESRMRRSTDQESGPSESTDDHTPADSSGASS